MMRACQLCRHGTEKYRDVPLALHRRRRRRRFKRSGDVRKINSREHRESCACTGRGSTIAMQRGSAARRSLPPPPSISRRASRSRSAPCCSLLSISFVTVMPQAPMPPHSQAPHLGYTIASKARSSSATAFHRRHFAACRCTEDQAARAIVTAA